VEAENVGEVGARRGRECERRQPLWEVARSARQVASGIGPLPSAPPPGNSVAVYFPFPMEAACEIPGPVIDHSGQPMHGVDKIHVHDATHMHISSNNIRLKMNPNTGIDRYPTILF